MMLLKRCSSCHENKPLSDYNKQKSAKSGLSCYCRMCTSIKSKQWKDTHREKYKENRRRTRYSWGFTPRGIYDRLHMNAHNGAGGKVLFTPDEFVAWFANQSKVCHYCGRELTMGVKDGDGIKGPNKLTIDRKDNTEPYFLDNIVLSCRRCNASKGGRLTENQMVSESSKPIIIKSDNPKPSSTYQTMNGTSKLLPEQVYKIRQLYKDGCPFNEIALQFGIAKSSVGNVVKRRTWANL